MSDMKKTYPDRHHVAVLDEARGLMWAAADVLQEAVTAEEADRAVSMMRLLGHADWRVPTIQELLSLVDYSRHHPSIDTDLFPDCKPTWYWTSTPVAWRSGARWIVYFSGGYGSSCVGGLQARVRAVRSVR